jgi:spore maturation protein A
MSLIFFVLVVFSLIKLTISAPNMVLSTALGASASGVTLAITLAGIYIVWMGVIKVAEDAGLIDQLAKLMRPIIRFLFGKQSDEVNALLATNISANIIGAGNAATPAAIDAIEKMSTPEMTRATTPMIMLFVLSATSLQLIPTTVIGILESHGATNAASVIFPTILVSGITTVLGVILVKLFSFREKRKAKTKDRTHEQNSPSDGRGGYEADGVGAANAESNAVTP